MIRQPHYCSFCGKRDYEVDVLCAGPGGVFICSECIDLCTEIVATKRKDLLLEREMKRCAGCAPAPLRETAGAA